MMQDASLPVRCCRGAQSLHLQGEAFQFLGVFQPQDGGTMLPQNFSDYLLFHCTICQKTCIFNNTAVRTSSSHDFSLSVYELQSTHQCWPLCTTSCDGSLGTVPSACWGHFNLNCSVPDKSCILNPSNTVQLTATVTQATVQLTVTVTQAIVCSANQMFH